MKIHVHCTHRKLFCACQIHSHLCCCTRINTRSGSLRGRVPPGSPPAATAPPCCSGTCAGGRCLSICETHLMHSCVCDGNPQLYCRLCCKPPSDNGSRCEPYVSPAGGGRGGGGMLALPAGTPCIIGYCDEAVGDGRTGERTDGRKNGRTDGRTEGRTDGRTDRRTDE